jgi:serine/threonine-protein kinase
MKSIGKYIVCGLLGRGGMSVVYKAILPVVRKVVALKWFSPHPTLISLWGEAAVRRRFVTEAILMGSIRHPHVVEILDFDLMEGRPFFTMQYYSRNLGMLMGEGGRTDSECRRLPLDDAIRHGGQLLHGLGRLHRAGLIHRDIKPHNLLLSDEGQLKISDLGLSKVRGETSSRQPAGLVVGSPFYAAPEQVVNADHVDLRADLYSVGVVIHRMITGHFPDEIEGPASQLHPDAGDEWDVFLGKALHKDPGSRFPGTAEMLEALGGLDKAWKDRKLHFCGLSDSTGRGGRLTEAEEPLPPRHAPVKVAPGKAREVFACDSLWRPVRYRRAGHPYVRSGPGVLFDEGTGLTWQSTGSEDPMIRQDATKYVARLNEDAFSGITGWRIPTVDELFTTLDPPVLDRSHCEGPVFDRSKTCLWSSDKCSFVSAWYVDIELCFAGWADSSSLFFVRAVCGRPDAKSENAASRRRQLNEG